MHKFNKGLRPTPRTPPANDNYRDNYERIFGSKQSFGNKEQTQKERNSNAT